MNTVVEVDAPERTALRKKGINILFSLRVFLLFIVLAKSSQINIWPHTYAIASYEQPKLLSYAYFLVDIIAMSVSIIHIKLIFRLFIENAFAFIFLLYAAFVLILFSSKGDVVYSVLQLLDYYEIFIAISLVIYIDGEKVLLRHLAYFGSVFLTLNLISIAVPSLSFMEASDHSGGIATFRGLTQQRNDISQLSVFFYFVSLCGQDAIKSQIKYFNAFLALLFILISGSAQGLILALLGTFLSLHIKYRKITLNPIFLLLILAMIIIGIMLYSNIDALNTFLGFFGRDSTFTDRVNIWGLARYLFRDMPWYGYGLGPVRSRLLSPELLHNFHLDDALFNTSHSAYYEALLTFGFIGGGLFFLIPLQATLRGLRYVLTKKAIPTTLPIVFVFLAVVGGYTAAEKMFLPQFGWLTLVIASTMLSKFSKKAKPSKAVSRNSSLRSSS